MRITPVRTLLLLTMVLAFTACGKGGPSRARASLVRNLSSLCESNADALYVLAVWASSMGFRVDSKRLLRKVIKVERDHHAARSRLGYERFQGEWVTKREKERILRRRTHPEPMVGGAGCVWCAQHKGLTPVSTGGTVSGS